MIIDILGWAAIAVLLPSTWPQIIKNFRRKSTEGVSFGTFLTLFLGMMLFFVVSLFRPTPLPILVNFGLGMVGYGIVLFQMAMYRKRGMPTHS